MGFSERSPQRPQENVWRRIGEKVMPWHRYSERFVDQFEGGPQRIIESFTNMKHLAVHATTQRNFEGVMEKGLWPHLQPLGNMQQNAGLVGPANGRVRHLLEEYAAHSNELAEWPRYQRLYRRAHKPTSRQEIFARAQREIAVGIVKANLKRIRYSAEYVLSFTSKGGSEFCVFDIDAPGVRKNHNDGRQIEITTPPNGIGLLHHYRLDATFFKSLYHTDFILKDLLTNPIYQKDAQESTP